MKFLIPLVLLVAMVSPVKAQMNCGDLGEAYLEFAKPQDAPDRVGVMVGFLIGFVWGFANGEDELRNRLPQGVSADQLSNVVGQWIRANPQHWHREMYWCVDRAIRETSP